MVSPPKSRFSTKQNVKILQKEKRVHCIWNETIETPFSLGISLLATFDFVVHKSNEISHEICILIND